MQNSEQTEYRGESQTQKQKQVYMPAACNRCDNP
jgi:Fe-S-cluster-containing dehydrogenase component